MRAVIWTGFAVFMLVWTAFIWAAAEVAGSAAQALVAGAAVDVVRGPIGLSGIPEWLKVWLGPDLLQPVLAAVRGAGQALETALPWTGAAVGLLTPLMWVAWLVVAVLVLVGAIVLH
ncbi:MAG: hypothetical protein EON92_13685, partial [Burkholderiales bacterium]